MSAEMARSRLPSENAERKTGAPGSGAPRARGRTLLHRASLVLLIASFLTILWALPVREFADALEEWSRDLGTSAAFGYAGAFVVFTIVSLPVWPMPILAGALFGTVRGTALASVSIVLAAAVTFGIARLLIARTSLREMLERSPRMRALEETVKAGDWKVVAAVRLSHFLTFGLQNYGFGLTRIGFWKFLVTTWLVTLPGTFLQAYVGNLGFDGLDAWREAEAADWMSWGLRLAGLAAIAGAVLYLGYLARSVYFRALNEELEKAVHREDAAEAERWSWTDFLLPASAAVVCIAAVCAVVWRG